MKKIMSYDDEPSSGDATDAGHADWRKNWCISNLQSITVYLTLVICRNLFFSPNTESLMSLVMLPRLLLAVRL